MAYLRFMLYRRDALSYRDETSIFYEDPHLFMRQNFPAATNFSLPLSMASGPDTAAYTWPSHLIVFEELLARPDQVSGRTYAALLKSQGYLEEKRIWNSFWHEEPKRNGDIVVFSHASLQV